MPPGGRLLPHPGGHTGGGRVSRRAVSGGEPLHRRLGAVLSVHNAGFQGHFPPETLAALGLPGELYNPPVFEWNGRRNILKAGLTFADRAATVSPPRARELLTPAVGLGPRAQFS